jgi:hypothetical protein
MVQRTVRYGAIVTVVPTFLLSLVILISAVHYSDAQAKPRTTGGLACGQQLKQQCGGVPVQANNMLECLKRTKKSFTDDASFWRTMLCAGATETQRSIARLSSRVKATFSDV